MGTLAEAQRRVDTGEILVKWVRFRGLLRARNVRLTTALAAALEAIYNLS